MKLLTFIEKGQAIPTLEGLRCAAPRKDKPGAVCNKLLVKRASNGQIAGNFRCERCRQEVEVVMKPARTDIVPLR